MKETLQAMAQIFARSALQSRATAKWGLFESRILQAATTSTNILRFLNDLMLLMQTDSLESGWVERVTPEVKDSASILGWICDNHKLAAALAVESRRMEPSSLDAAIDAIDLRTTTSGDERKFLPPSDFDIPITIMLRSPLSHGADTRAGNATLFRRKRVIDSVNGAPFAIPFYAGNALRGHMRDLLADDFIASLGLIPSRKQPPIALWFFHTLYSGGALTENKLDKRTTKAIGEKANAFGIGERSDLRELVIPLSLLGCAINKTVLSGRLQVADFYPYCRETGHSEVRVAELLSWEYLTRRDDLDTEHSDNASMIAVSEVMAPGTVLAGGIDLDPGTRPIEVACLHRGLELLREHAKLGAGSRMGWGIVDIEYGIELDSSDYEKALADRRSDTLELLIKAGAIGAGD